MVPIMSDSNTVILAGAMNMCAVLRFCLNYLCEESGAYGDNVSMKVIFYKIKKECECDKRQQDQK